MGGLLKATAVLSTVCALSGLAFYLGVLGPVERMAQTGIFSTQSYGFLLSVGLAAGFLTSAAVARASRRRNLPEPSTEDSVPVPPETETV